MASDEIGQIISTGGGRFKWIIEDFLSNASEMTASFCSPDFSFSGASCYLSLCLYKDSMLKMFFTMRSINNEKIHVDLGMNTGCSGERVVHSGETDNGGVFYVHDWILCSEILDRRAEILPDGRLTVFCELERLDLDDDVVFLQNSVPSVEIIVVESENEDSERVPVEDEFIRNGRPLKKMRNDFKTLLDSGEDSDVIINVQGEEFRAHRIILRARSTVFKSMFTRGTVETQSGVVTVEDSDPATFLDFLDYLYTGNTQHICEGNVCQLYTDADKYGAGELKEECAVFMKRNLSAGRFCDIINLAVRHNERELIDSATEFFCKNSLEITKTAKWVAFLRENTEEGNQLVIKALLYKRENGS